MDSLAASVSHGAAFVARDLPRLYDGATWQMRATPGRKTHQVAAGLPSVVVRPFRETTAVRLRAVSCDVLGRGVCSCSMLHPEWGSVEEHTSVQVFG